MPRGPRPPHLLHHGLLIQLTGDPRGLQEEALAERICRTMAEPLAVDGQTLTPGTSIGVALSTPEHDADRLLRAADHALYAAKAAGRNTWRSAQGD